MSSRMELLRPGQAAEALGITTRDLQKLVATGKIRSLLIFGKLTRFRQDEVESLMAGRPYTPADVRFIEGGQPAIPLDVPPALLWLVGHLCEAPRRGGFRGYFIPWAG